VIQNRLLRVLRAITCCFGIVHITPMALLAIGSAASAGSVNPSQSSEPRAITELDSIRAELLRSIGCEGPDDARPSARPKSLLVQYWPNWPNFGNWNNWPNWGNRWLNY
jgi:hypothetical protein